MDWVGGEINNPRRGKRVGQFSERVRAPQVDDGSTGQVDHHKPNRFDGRYRVREDLAAERIAVEHQRPIETKTRDPGRRLMGRVTAAIGETPGAPGAVPAPPRAVATHDERAAPSRLRRQSARRATTLASRMAPRQNTGRPPGRGKISRSDDGVADPMVLAPRAGF
ncbi:hypothetical protein [Pirellulimonas nuda]|uniref:hypothetical protein n=1 Tax=Pirellulimonas nuda TaxID=2528009 RepID=UPI0011A6A544|nr:hypothetical protein [Pirellulimonas nuda]